MSGLNLQKLKELKQLFYFCNINNSQYIEYSKIIEGKHSKW